MRRQTLLFSAALAASASAASGQTLTNLPAGHGTSFGCLSGNGEWVTGTDSVGDVYRWSIATGVTSYTGGMSAQGISDDGNTIYAETDLLSGEDTASTYNIAAGVWTDLGTDINGGVCSGTQTGAYGASHDATVATGLGWEGCKGFAFRYDLSADPKMDFLPKAAPGTGSSRGNCVSGDGEYIGGWDRNGPNGTSTDRACIWDSDGNQTFPLANGADPDGYGEVWGLSTDGDWACGQREFGGEPAFRWERATGTITNIPIPPGAAPADAHVAQAISDDGKVIVGYSGNSFFGTAPRAWIWTESGGTQLLVDYLAAAGIFAAAPMYAAWDLSADGRTILGSYASFVGFPGDAWVVERPDPVADLGGASAGTGGLVPTLSASGSFFPGAPVSFELTDALPSSLTVYLVAATDTPIPLFGGTMHALPALFLQNILSSPAGDWSLSGGWPAGAFSGLSLVFQVAVFDPGAVGSFALSNGLMCTTP